MLYLVLILIFAFLIAIKTLDCYLRSAKGKGVLGEKLVSMRLRDGLGPEYEILNDIYLPTQDGATTQIDHVVVSKYGIFVVETKNYSGWIFGDAKAAKWTKSDYGKKSQFQNPMRQNYRHICALSENLGIPKDYFIGIVAFCGTGEFKTEMPEGVVYSRRAAKYIKSYSSQIIKDEQVHEIAEVILEWQATLSKQQIAAHVQNLNVRHAK
ncbi:MAG: NERD domain-containing protein [Kiritimatiellae bacterium]|nr:NERD domain-containing protein [Kiritimatiellia bacterium]